MIDFKTTFKADQLLYGDYDESDFKSHVQKISTTS